MISTHKCFFKIHFHGLQGITTTPVTGNATSEGQPSQEERPGFKILSLVWLSHAGDQSLHKTQQNAFKENPEDSGTLYTTASSPK